MTSSDSSGKDATDTKGENGNSSSGTCRPPSKPIPEGQECFLKGSESQFELLEGVQHSDVVGEYRLWDGPSLLATQYICNECSARLGHPLEKVGSKDK